MLRTTRVVLFVLILLSFSAASFAQIGVAITIAPPPLPVYAQPICPGVGYIWVPGYWAYDYSYGGYYWVPGTWVLAPQVGYLWTPPWWGWSGAAFIFHAGYWGPTVGFYGGINYGFGYPGYGYEGGRWNNGVFFYNRAVNNINVTNVRNVYNVHVTNVTVNRVSYNGGPGGIDARPTAAEEAAARERHIPPVSAQEEQARAASTNQQLRASVNRGKPPVAATPRAGTFKGSGVVEAKAAGGPYRPPEERNAANMKATTAEHPETNVPRPPTPIHASEIPPRTATAPPRNATAEETQRYQQQQKLYQQQQAEHEQLARQQQADHERMAQQKATPAQMQRMEQQHQQQTMQMEQRHAQQDRQFEARPAAPPAPHGGEGKPGH